MKQTKVTQSVLKRREYHMKASFAVKATGFGIDVYISINDRCVSVTSFKDGDDIEAAIPSLIAKAHSRSIRALALENALNAYDASAYQNAQCPTCQRATG